MLVCCCAISGHDKVNSDAGMEFSFPILFYCEISYVVAHIAF